MFLCFSFLSVYTLWGQEKETLVLIDTDMGKIKVKLYNETPQHRDNFIKLINEGRYDGLIFHRIIKQFMVQGGDVTSKDAPIDKPLGDGDLGYTVPAEIVFVLPNNKNIVMAAQQCAGLSEKKVIVIPTATVPQGISAMMAVDPDETDAAAIEQAMNAAASAVTTAQITYAARNSEFDGFAIREGGRTVNVTVVVATGVNETGHREVLGVDVVTSEDGAAWLAFLRSLVARGLRSVKLTISDAHPGLKAAIADTAAEIEKPEHA